jgi:hypothetical protein
LSQWKTYCNDSCPFGVVNVDYPFDAALGRCSCITENLDSVCDSACRQAEQSRQQIICKDPPIYVVRDDQGTIVFSAFTSEISSDTSDFGVVACNTLDGRAISAFTIQATASGFSGLYEVDLETLESIGVISTEGRRRREVVSNPQILNPIVCLELGQVVIFSVSEEHYPIFDRNSLLNDQVVCCSFSWSVDLIFAGS